MSEESRTPRSLGLEGVLCVPPMEGGGEFGVVDVILSRLPIQNGGTDASTVVAARHNLFTWTPTTVNAVGDMYWRGSATALNRLAIGHAGQVLTVSASRHPIWADPTGGNGTGPGPGTGGGIEEAPDDGLYYVRQNEGWSDAIDDGVY